MNRPTTTAGLHEQLWQAVVAADEYAAVDLVVQAMDDGVSGEDLLLDVIARVQERIGSEWAADRLTVAQEHAATAINERVVTALSHHRAMRQGKPSRGRVTVCCVDGEWHAFPARLVAEILQLRGWQVDYLGAQTPTPHLIAHLHSTNPAAVLLSGSIPTHLPNAHRAVTACQATGVPVVAGGRAFGADGRYARVLGADGWAPDARAAAALLEEGLTRSVTSAGRQALDDLPHLADQEYTMVVQARPRLVRQTVLDLETRFSAMAGYDDEQRERTAEDIAHIIDFLATALYVDDAEVFLTFLTWTAHLLEARKVPAASLLVGLDILAEQLHDFPRALRILTAGRSALHAMAAGPPALAEPAAAGADA
ncbi:cobalamin-binding protein [Streptomyces sp. SBST2-5]|uniref:Cobalamin-binding protein n=1 Tax=Streptomyces composti TaxID=2720025 RepID=A0ABX1A6T2_9ACTN|nr:cobalamin-dependent protein [Streptomyces composti]NJP49573.1 cobalamin-binding protein [Streptomyces composti]